MVLKMRNFVLLLSGEDNDQGEGVSVSFLCFFPPSLFMFLLDSSQGICFRQ